MTLVEQYRDLWDSTQWLESHWRQNFGGKSAKFYRSFGDLTVDSEVEFGQGQRGILLLLAQSNGHAAPDTALIGTVTIKGQGKRQVIDTHQYRCPISTVHPVSSHGGPGHEAEPSQPL